jgi:hypothetical protein
MMSKREKIKSKKITDVLISSETSSLVKLLKLKDFYLRVVMIVQSLSIGIRMMK